MTLPVRPSFKAYAFSLALGIFGQSSFAFATEVTGAAGATEGRPTLWAAKAKKGKKSKKKKKDDSEFGMDTIDEVEDNDKGVGVHRDQEGTDTPYSVEMGGATEITNMTTSTKDGDPTTELKVSIDGHWNMLFLGGHLGVGPDIGVAYTSQDETTVDAANPSNKKTTTKTSLGLRLGPQFRYFFGQVDKALTLPFLSGGAAYESLSTKSGDTSIDYTGYSFRAGGGLAIFVDSNVAFVIPRIEYESKSLSGEVPTTTSTPQTGTTGSATTATATANEKVTTTTSGFRVLLEIMTFL